MDKVHKNSILSIIIAIAAVCVIFGIMQGVHDNYGIMLNSLSDRTGLDYAAVSFVIGIGALIYGVAQPFMGMIALRKSNTFVMLLGIIMTACGLIVAPFCKGFITFLIFSDLCCR